MKSVGEAMAIGRTFKESFQKQCVLEIGLKGFEAGKLAEQDLDKSATCWSKRPSAERPQYLYKAFEEGFTAQQISEQSGIDPWFVSQLEESILSEKKFPECPLSPWTMNPFVSLKKLVSDRQLADYWSCKPSEVRSKREEHGISTTYRLVDTQC